MRSRGPVVTRWNANTRSRQSNLPFVGDSPDDVLSALSLSERKRAVQYAFEYPGEAHNVMKASKDPLEACVTWKG